MIDQQKVEQIMTYLQDLADISTEHAKTCVMCANPLKSAYCVMRATISVEITVYRNKLNETR